MKILVCDDDKEIARAIEIYLKNDGYDVVKAFDGDEALRAVEDEDVQLVIMDVMMPKMDGINATRKIREKKNIPIIILSARSEADDKIYGLNMGADDYVTKPFDPNELLARVRSQLRRYTSLGCSDVEKRDDVLTTGGLVLDDSAKTVTVDGRKVSLTATEFRILRLLMQRPGDVFTMEQIYENVWNEPAVNPANTVAVHIRHIREKIEINPKSPQYLKVVWGIGYKIERMD
jgi:DNA-binding response OmpR family regulator